MMETDQETEYHGQVSIDSLPVEILEKILDKTDKIQHLTNYRLVSRKWAKVSSPLFLKRLEDLQLVISPGENLLKYYEYLENHSGIPYPNINLKFYDLENEMVQLFLSKFGKTITSLLLTNDHFLPYLIAGINNAPAVRRIFLEQCTNLKTFHTMFYNDTSVSNGFLLETERAQNQEKITIKTKLKNISFQKGDHSKYLIDLILISPSLEKLEFPEYEPLSTYATVFNIILANGMEKTIKELGIKTAEEEISAILKNMGNQLKLEELDVHPYWNNDFRSFMDSQAESLKVLSISNSYFIVDDEENILISLPQKFPKLEKFYFYDHNMIDDLFATSFEPHSFCQRFPSLRLLEFGLIAEAVDFDGLLNFDEGEEPHFKLIELKLPRFLSPDQICKFREIFPNVKKLDTDIQSAKVIRMCYTLWPKLEEFLFCPDFSSEDYLEKCDHEIFGNEELRMDALLTGFTSERQMKLAMKSGMQPILPSINNLKCLKTLDIDNQKGDFKISEYSVKLALIPLKLKQIYLPDEAISDLPESLRIQIGLDLKDTLID